MKSRALVMLLCVPLAGCPPQGSGNRASPPESPTAGQPTSRAPSAPATTGASHATAPAATAPAATGGPAASGAPASTTAATAATATAASEPSEYNFEELEIPADPAKGAAPAGAPPRVGQLRGLYVDKNNGLERCFTDANKGAKAPVAFRVGTLASIKPSGEVTSVTTTGDSPAPVNACVQAAIKAWKFPGGAQAYTVKRVLAYKPR